MHSEEEQSVEALKAQLKTVHREMSDLTAAVMRNDDKMQRTQQRELRLLQAEDLYSLLIVLVKGLRASYGLRYVSVVLWDPDHSIRHLLLANGTPAEEFSNLLFTETLKGLALQYVAFYRPWLGAYTDCDHGKICPGAEGIESIAMIPLRHHGKLIGSINLCSGDEHRFTREHASDFLAHLGIIASFCVENAINRARLLRSGFTDVLTGWHNRRYLRMRLEEELVRARRDRAGITCLLLDVDHFKRVNDTWGHAAGDAVLQEIAHRIESQVRETDVAARYGGEEFVVLMPEIEVAAATLLAERVREAVSATVFDLPGGDTVSMTVSIGISEVYPGRDDKDLKAIGDALVERADIALYAAKSAGRDRVFVEAA